MQKPSEYYSLKPPKIIDRALLKSLYTDRKLNCSQIAWLCDTDPVYIGKQLRICGIPLRGNGKRPQLRLRKKDKGGLCPLCGKDVKRRVEHHWWELPDYSPHAAWICRTCNILLKPSAFGIAESHVLPNFEKQGAYIQHRLYPRPSQPIKTRQYATTDTTVVAFRLNDKVYAAIQIKAAKKNLSIGDYLKELANKEALRSHHKKGKE